MGVLDGLSSFYAQFLYRDVFSFLLPGATVSFCIYAGWAGPEAAFHAVGTFPVWVVLGLLAGAYIVGVALQMLIYDVLGWFKLGLFQYHDLGRGKEEEYYARLADFYRTSTERGVRQLERFVVLKQLGSNNFAALAIGLGTLGLRLISVTLARSAAVVLVVALLISLYVCHRVHLRRQMIWEKAKKTP